MTDPEKQELIDSEHLRLLRLGYLIAGFANAVWALFPLIHISIGLMILVSGFPGPSGKADPDQRFMGLFFVLMGGAFSLIFAAAAVLKLMTARRIRERRSKTFCMVTAGLSCIGIPYGTVLGVFTFIVLARPSVDRQFHGRAAGVTPPEATTA
jgi:hypothetical protein